MGKKTDRAFHLTVAALAITLAVVSLGTVEYQNHPQWMRQWLKQQGAKVAPSVASRSDNKATNHTGNSIGGGTGAQKTVPNNNTAAGSKPGTSASDVAFKPSYKMDKNSMLIKVKGVGSDTTAADVNRVNTTLDKYQIVSLVSQALQMNVYQEISILVAKSPSDYQKALASLGVSSSDAKQFTLDTGGFTQGGTVVIPLYQNTNTSDLANTLSHELTHAFLNMNVGNFPSWMNEGLAVTDGMIGQSRAENTVEYQGYARQMAENILSATKQGQLWPLEGNEQKVLSGTAPYDLELQDWLAVRDLISTKGYNAFSDYFYRLNLGESEATAFQRSFGMTESAFNTQFTNQLKTAASVGNDAVSLTFSVPSTYQGAIRFLQHGNINWTGFRPKPGQTTVTIAQDGSVSGVSNTTTPIQDSNPADNTTLYVNLDPTTPLTYNGQSVKDSGFAFDYHYGMYGFVNGWVTLANGQSIYFHTPTLFGLSITNVTESAPDKWLTGLLIPPSLTSSQTVAASSGSLG